MSARGEKLAKLVIRSHGGAEYEIPLDKDRISIGRNKGSDIVLEDEFTSRNHAFVERRGKQYYICDEASTNGTSVRDERVAGSRHLRSGDEIRIGETKILYREESSGQSTTRALQRPSKEQVTSPIQVDAQAWQVWVEGKRLAQKLSVLEFKLVGYLYARADTDGQATRATTAVAHSEPKEHEANRNEEGTSRVKARPFAGEMRSGRFRWSAKHCK